MARLAKGWNSTIICTKSLFGRSYTFELLGIQAGREEEDLNSEPSILRAFRLLLKRVENIGQQRIVFDYSEDYYSRFDTPHEILAQKPLIVDPSNPYNNVMSSFRGRISVQQLFSDCAKESLQRLEAVEKEIEMGNDFPNLKEIFLPQPVGLASMPPRWLIGAQSGVKRLQPKVVVQKTTLKKRSEISDYQKAFSAFLFISDIESNYKTMPGDRKMSAQDSIEKAIYHLLGMGPGSAGQSSCVVSPETHTDFDVTFEIPIGSGGDDILILSSNWA